jgi:hypothetical protein
MDPYLESPVHWRGFHHLFITTMTQALNTGLPPGFAANIDERVYLVRPERALYPDITLVARHDAPPPALVKQGSAAATAVFDTTDAPALLTIFPDEMREGFIEVRTVGGDEEQVVTVIEVLSPANKAPGSEGRDPYVRKQEQLLRSDVSLLEIDLLRSGAHTIAVPHNTLQAAFGTWDYLVCLHRGGQRWDFEVWRNTVHARLPRVRVPLTNEHPDVLLDLQGAFDHAYDAGPYKRRVDYRKEPDPPLSDEDTAWADELLTKKGLRP